MKNSICKSLLLSIVLILSFGSLAAAQTDIPLLKLGDAVEKEIKAGEVHSYSLDVPANKQFLFVVVEQRGIDLVAKLVDADKKKILEVDTPNGRQGAEAVSLVIEKAGKYQIDVFPLNTDVDPGRYQIRFEKLQPAANTREGRIDQMFSLWDRPNSPGAAVAVAKDGEIIFKKGYGSAQLEYEIPITASTVFHVASVSKQFTAFAVTMLANQSKLSLDDDIRKHIPEVLDLGHTITLRHLIHHISGMRDQWNLLVMAGWRMDDVITKDHILKLISRQKELNFEPGAEYLYCNTGYTLLAEVVARVSGKSFREWTAEHLFDPLGMTATHFHDDHEFIVPNRSYSYRESERGGFQKSVLSYANVGATSLFTTAEDLVKWSENLSTGVVGGQEVIKQVIERGKLNNGRKIGYAFGLGIGSYRGLKTVAHSGGDAGFRSRLIRFPDQKFTVVVLSNLASFDPTGMANRVAEEFLGDKMRKVRLPRKSKIKEVEVAPEILAKYPGVYQVNPWNLLTIEKDGDRLVLTEETRPRLIPLTETKFKAENTVQFYEFISDDTGKVTHIKRGAAKLPKVERFKPDAGLLKEYTGDYYSEELATVYTFVIRKDKLVAIHQRHPDTEINPTVKDYFIGSSFGLRNIEIVRDGKGKVIGMKVSNGRVRNLKFKKVE